MLLRAHGVTTQEYCSAGPTSPSLHQQLGVGIMHQGSSLLSCKEGQAPGQCDPCPPQAKQLGISHATPRDAEQAGHMCLMDKSSLMSRRTWFKRSLCISCMEQGKLQTSSESGKYQRTSDRPHCHCWQASAVPARWRWELPAEQPDL